MKTVEELTEQFEKEGTFWQQKLQRCKQCKEAALYGAELTEFGDDIKLWAAFTNINCDYYIKMGELDKEHKKFLLKWKRKIHRRVFLEKLLKAIGA